MNCQWEISQKLTSGDLRASLADKHGCDPFPPAHAFRSREGDFPATELGDVKGALF